MRKLLFLFAIYFSILPAIAFAGRHSFPSRMVKGASAAFEPRHVHGRIGGPANPYWKNGIARAVASASAPGQTGLQAPPSRQTQAAHVRPTPVLVARNNHDGGERSSNYRHRQPAASGRTAAARTRKNLGAAGHGCPHGARLLGLRR